MADKFEKTLHITATLVGEAVDSIDILELLKDIEGVEITSINQNLYVKPKVDKK